MNYAFVSMVIPDNMISEIHNISKKNMQDAANALQWHLYNGLCINLKSSIKLINTLPVGSFPQYCEKIIFNKSTFTSHYHENNVNVGFLNLKLIRKFSQFLSLLHELDKWCNNIEGPKTIFVYTASTVFLKVIYKLRKKYTDVIICNIIADLPGFTNLSSKKNVVLQIYDKYRIKSFYKYVDLIDYYVLLTKHMADYLKIKKPFCVVEGISTKFELSNIKEHTQKSDDIKTILYSGTLHRKFGVLNLVKAFHNIPYSNYRLQLCGIGDSEQEIIAATLNDPRINYLGRLTRNETLELQRKATVLVNPRQDNEEFTKYSFPSKNLEYLSSGVPTIGYKLAGIPDEYDNYINYVENDTIEALSDKILEICEMSEEQRNYVGYLGQEFVNNNKNEIVQTNKIVKMLSDK